MTSRKKAAIAGRLPVRRGLDEAEAAVYVSVSPSYFRRLVAQRVMPLPRLVGTRRVWDVDELDLAFKQLPREGGDDEAIFGTSSDKSSWADFK